MREETKKIYMLKARTISMLDNKPLDKLQILLQHAANAAPRHVCVCVCIQMQLGHLTISRIRRVVRTERTEVSRSSHMRHGQHQY